MFIPSLLDEIRAANRSYADLPRHDGDARAMLARKLEMSYWRRMTVGRILDAAEKGGEDREGVAEAILGVNLHLGPSELARLQAVLGDDDLFGRVAARQGIRHPASPQYHAEAGPAMDLKIQANRDSPWSWQKWTAIPAFSEYAFHGDMVSFRGLELQAGDVILANVNLDGNMVYSALSDPKGVYTHSAVLVFLRDGERRFPAVVETYEKGVRAVPLAVFLNARFLAAAEVYRHRDVGPEHSGAFSEAAEAMIRDTRGYNCASWDDDRTYLSCTSVGRFLLEDVGVDGVEPRSAISHPQIRRNLQRVGYQDLDPFFAPVDYLLNPRFGFVGAIDNHQFARLTARELVEHRFRTAFEKVELDPSLLPFMQRVNHFALTQMRRQSPIGKVIGVATGFTDVNLPKGPDSMIAGIQPAEHQLARAVTRMIPEVEAYVARRGDFRFREILEDGEIREKLVRYLSPRWLEP